MSTKYTGGFITKSPVAPTTTAASGIWTLDQQQQAQKAGTWPAPPNFIEDVFSTYLYTGTSANQTITNGIDLSGKGGLVWSKRRSGAESHVWLDTARNNGSSYIASDDTGAQGTAGNFIQSFNSNGYSIGSNNLFNLSGTTNVSWTFREQPKFFDIVTYTGTGVARAISHNLGSVPGCMIVKKTSGTENWLVYHRGLSSPENNGILLNSLAAQQGPGISSYWNSTAPTSTQFTVGTNDLVNQSGATYVAYLFAHNAGGFGLTGTDNVISCGSYTGNGSATGPTVTLGYEPQWVLVKRTDSTSSWTLSDNMRGQPVDGATAILFPNLSDAEASATTAVSPTATGFQVKTSGATYNASGGTYIYIAIRRGPMKVPTSGTSVFDPETSSASTGTAITTSFPIDLQISHYRPGADNVWWMDRLRGANSPGVSNSTAYLLSDNANAESSTAGVTNSWDNTGFKIGSAFSGASYVYWNFRRAPSFFDEVCYTGNGADNHVQTHNLSVAPELLIIKNRSAQGSGDWFTFHTFTVSNFKQQLLDTTNAQTNYSYGSFFMSQPTTANFSLNNGAGCNNSGTTYVAYLFATCAGVSKVGSYTGTGALQTVNCGFTGGARFVLIKRTNTSGSWFVWDTARGMVSGTDPALTLNTTNAEFNADSVYSVATGFQLLASPAEAINTNGDTYIFLAIA